jgi:hypothetical protein
MLIIGGGLSQVHAQGFQRVSYGDDLFAVGGGARAMGMGGAQVAMVGDVTAGFWNPAGLAHITQRELSYMHSERFGGLVAYDYAGFAAPLRASDDVIGISFFRQGVDGIKNTLSAWDRERDQPRANPQNYITEFSTYDMALLLSYATRYNESLTWGASAKLVYSRLGPFANGFGYSIDAGAQYRSGRFMAGVVVNNLTTLMKLWTVNEDELEPLRTFFSDEELNASFPTGQNEYTRPSLRSGVATWRDLNDFRITGAFDLQVHAEERRTNSVNLGALSFQPHLGVEGGYKETIFLRVGLTDVYTDRDSRLFVSPTLGAGFHVGALTFDYGFASFTGMNAVLGNTHRISAMLRF